MVSHGQLAHELLAAAEMIVGEISHIQAVSIGWHDDVNDAHNEIERRIAEAEKGSGVLILTDMFGGTPSNIAFSFHDPGRVDVITGVNLPMIIKIASQKKKKEIQSLTRSIYEQGRTSIAITSDFLAS